eukprot:TRINITY_DN3876_c0_g1_i1.p1 TRINITY_DN3876_c0_g1~~TRINITY_DN3876_c0_g1_i1.p1  ORF type:complete len:138 (+),score=42.13 TRINITY_DN3876_c0_g1_i1:66-479(+)
MFTKFIQSFKNVSSLSTLNKNLLKSITLNTFSTNSILNNYNFNFNKLYNNNSSGLLNKNNSIKILPITNVNGMNTINRINTINEGNLNLTQKSFVAAYSKRRRGIRRRVAIKAKWKRMRKQKLGWFKKSPNKNRQPF